MINVGVLGTASGGEIWDQGDVIGSAIDDLLQSENPSLESLLKEDELLQEVKGQNEGLISFLCQEENLEKLIGYVINMPAENQSTDDVTESFENLHLSSEGQAGGGFGANASLNYPSANHSGPGVQEANMIKEFFPYVATEVFSCENADIIHAVINSEDNKMMIKLFSFLDQEPPLDARIAGYFYKVFAALTSRNVSKMLKVSVDRGISGEGVDTNQPGWLVHKFLRHIDSYSITCCFKLLLQVASEEPIEYPESGTLVGSDTSSENEIGFIAKENQSLLLYAHTVWLGGCGVAAAVLKTIEHSEGSESQANAAELLEEMIQRAALSRLSLQEGELETAETSKQPDLLPKFHGLILNNVGCGPNAEAALMESGVEWTLNLSKELVEVALRTKQQTPKLQTEEIDIERFALNIREKAASVAAIQVLSQLVSAFALDRWSAPSPEVKARCEHIATSADEHSPTPAEIACILERLPDICNVLKGNEAECDDSKTLSTQWGSKLQPLGLQRLKTVELIFMLVYSRYPSAINALAESDDNPIGLCLDLFFKYEWCNMLHATVERMLLFIFTGGVSEESLGLDHHMDQAALEQEFSHVTNENNEKETRMKKKEIAMESKAAQRELVALQRVIFDKDKCNLLDRILKAYKENKQANEESEKYWVDVERKQSGQTNVDLEVKESLNAPFRRHRQKGYMGYCHRLAHLIQALSDEQRKKYLKMAQEDEAGARDRYPAVYEVSKRPQWSELVQGELAAIQEVEQFLLGGYMPNKIQLEQSDMGFSQSQNPSGGSEYQNYTDGVASFNSFANPHDSSQSGDQDGLASQGSGSELDSGANTLAQEFDAFDFGAIENQEDDVDPFSALDGPLEPKSQSVSNIQPAGLVSTGTVEEEDPFAVLDRAEADKGVSLTGSSEVNTDEDDDPFAALDKMKEGSASDEAWASFDS